MKKLVLHVVDADALRVNGLAGKNDLIKILNRGEISSAVEVHAHGFSKSAIEAIEKAGGKVVKL